MSTMVYKAFTFIIDCFKRMLEEELESMDSFYEQFA